MKAPYSWLKDFVNINITPEELGEKLVSAGFEIEEYIYPYLDYKNIVVGEILEINKHPNADKLLVCKVNIGEKTVQIVTNAKNISVEDYVPVCLDGGHIKTTKIVKGELRGVQSDGMFCGASDFDLTDADYEGITEDGIFILGHDYPPGTDINKVIGTDDCILDVAVTANRPDCNSILGIAREVAAVLNTPLKMPDFSNLPQGDDNVGNYVSVSVLDSNLCPRYMAKALKNIKITRSSDLIRKRLRLVGLRPINNIVDITNYILIEFGQPMHAFDKEFLSGGEIIVRRAVEGEKIITLDGKENVLDNSNLVICDKDKPVALAGIMGGLNSGINNDTKTIILESARFKRDNIRKSSKRLGIRSDSSTRFEKGIDFISQELAICRAVQLITESNCGEVINGVIDVIDGKLDKHIIKASCNKINAILGIVVPSSIMVDMLNRLQLTATVEDDILTVEVPQYREDIENANDLAEEIIRLYGYSNIENINLDGMSQTKGGRNKSDTLIQKIKRLLSGKSAFMETVTYSFVSPNFIKMLSLENDEIRKNVINLINPLGEELSVMRTTLLHSILNVVSSNINHGNKSGKLFEIGKIYLPKSLPIMDVANERETLILAEFGEGCDFYSLKAELERIANLLNVELKFVRSQEPFLHPGRGADVIINEERIGYIGEMHPNALDNYGIDQRVYIAEIDLEKMLNFAKDFLPFVAIPKYPSVTRDLAFVMDKDIFADRLLTTVKTSAGEFFESVNVFDVYEGKGVPDNKKSVAVNVSFRAKDRTLVDEEVVEAVENILKNVKTELNAVLRS